MSKLAIAQHWLHFCPSWKSFPKVNGRTLNDACRYFNRDEFRAGYVLPEGSELGHIILICKPASSITIVTKYGKNPREMLEAVQGWAERTMHDSLLPKKKSGVTADNPLTHLVHHTSPKHTFCGQQIYSGDGRKQIVVIEYDTAHAPTCTECHGRWSRILEERCRNHLAHSDPLNRNG